MPGTDIGLTGYSNCGSASGLACARERNFRFLRAPPSASSATSTAKVTDEPIRTAPTLPNRHQKLPPGSGALHPPPHKMHACSLGTVKRARPVKCRPLLAWNPAIERNFGTSREAGDVTTGLTTDLAVRRAFVRVPSA